MPLKKTVLYIGYWAGYLLLFSLIEGLPVHDLFTAFSSELVSLPVKIIFVALVVEKLADELFLNKNFILFCTGYVLLLVVSAFMLRLTDNYVILRYLLIHWKKEPLLSAAPFLYNAIKLQFLVTIPFCIKLFNYWTEEKMHSEQLQTDHAMAKAGGGADFIQVKCDRRMLKIPFADICYFEAQGNYLSIYTLTGVHKTYLVFSELEVQLPGSSFVRVHRSFIVSLAHVESFTNAYLNVNHKQIPIGRSYQLKARSALAQGAAHSQ